MPNEAACFSGRSNPAGWLLGGCLPWPSRRPSAFKLDFNLYTKRRQAGA